VVKQRLKLAAVSPKLLEVYAEDGMTLEQLMAFTVTGDHARQAQVWDQLRDAYNREPHIIRRMLTDGAVRATDKRVRFVGINAYEAAGGVVLRDLFEQDQGGWLQDPSLLDTLAAEKLQVEADAIRAEDWRWVEVANEFPYGHAAGLRRLTGEIKPLDDEAQARADTLRAEHEKLEAQCDTGEVSAEVDRRLDKIEAELKAIEQRPLAYDPEEIGRAGAFVSIAADGSLRVERGYVRPEDEPKVEPEDAESGGVPDASSGKFGQDASVHQSAVIDIIGPLSIRASLRGAHCLDRLSTKPDHSPARAGVRWQIERGLHPNRIRPAES
jgi:ParB family chromosome partitioning protein